MERYQLSQDFQERELQLLQRKYGGAQHAMQAALTIQRAFRRYSMVKKFADLTSQAKTEKRISRRLDYANTNANSSSSPLLESRKLEPSDESNSSSLLLYYHHHPHHHHHANHHRHMLFHHGGASLGAGSGGSAQQRDWRQQQSFDPEMLLPEVAPSSQKHLPEQAVAVVVVDAAGQEHLQNLPDEESTNSCPDIQSFPLDETSVYSHSPSSDRQSSQRSSTHSNKSGSTISSRSTGSPRESSNHHHHSNNINNNNNNNNPVAKGSKKFNSNNSGGSSTGGSAPSVPRRTVSRLSSLEKASSSRRAPAQLHQHQSSPHILGRGHGHHQPSIDNDCRVIRHMAYKTSEPYTVNEVIRKRHYRTGLNIFNKKPEKGISYLIRRGFLENSPQAVARFLITRKGLSKQMIGEYLGNLTYQFNMAALNCFALEMDFSGMQIDTALRKFQTFFRMPGEAQKIERLMEVFSSRYCQCNPEVVSKFRSADAVFILAFAIILLNTDLHTPSLKPEKRMKVEDFVKNLRGIDNGQDIESAMLNGIYERIRNQEFRPGSDHVTQVMKVQQTFIKAKCPNLAVPHRRLVCYCRLYEVHDPYKKERPGIHQREVFLFNDILVMTKIHSRKKNTVAYAFRQSYLLAGMTVNLFQTQFYPFGIQIAQKWDRKVVLLLNARNEHDRSKFVEDLKESIAEMDEMDALRLEAELEKQRHSMNDNRDSGINDPASGSSEHHSTLHSSYGKNLSTLAEAGVVVSKSSPSNSSGVVTNSNGVVLRRSAINNSLLDLSDANGEKTNRRGSVGSLDSGMSVSFQSTSVGSFCIGNGNGAAAAATGSSSSHNVSNANSRMMAREDCINRNFKALANQINK